jgi:hypothetical protein
VCGLSWLGFRLVNIYVCLPFHNGFIPKVIFKMGEPLLHARALRVIGQDLDELGVDCFQLAKSGDDYIVWPERTESTRRSVEKGFFSKIIQKILGETNSDRELPNRLYFTPTEIVSADAQRRLKRKISDSPSDRRDLSFVLRVLGNYLDRQRAADFAIRWSKYSAMVSYGQNEEYFTVQNLYDLGISMYLKRATGERRRG